MYLKTLVIVYEVKSNQLVPLWTPLYFWLDNIFETETYSLFSGKGVNFITRHNILELSIYRFLVCQVICILLVAFARQNRRIGSAKAEIIRLLPV